MVMNTESVPLPAPEDLATERLVAAVQPAIGVVQEHLANLAADGQDAKWPVSDGDAKASLATGARLLQLRNQLQGERPRTISVRSVHDTRAPRDIGNNNDYQPEYKGARK